MFSFCKYSKNQQSADIKNYVNKYSELEQYVKNLVKDKKNHHEKINNSLEEFKEKMQNLKMNKKKIIDQSKIVCSI